MSESMIPRITIPDDEDRATVIAALMHYSRKVSHVACEHGDITMMISEMRIAVDLLDEIMHQMKAGLDEKLGKFSDEDFSAAVDTFWQQMSRDDDDV